MQILIKSSVGDEYTSGYDCALVNIDEALAKKILVAHKKLIELQQDRQAWVGLETIQFVNLAARYLDASRCSEDGTQLLTDEQREQIDRYEPVLVPDSFILG